MARLILCLLAGLVAACTSNSDVTIVVVDAAAFHIGNRNFAAADEVVTAIRSNPGHGHVGVAPGDGVDVKGARFESAIAAMRSAGIDAQVVIVGNDVFAK